MEGQSDEQRLVCRLKPNTATAHPQWEVSQVSLALSGLSDPSDPTADAQAQRHRSLGDDAEKRVASTLAAVAVRLQQFRRQ